MNIFNWTKKNDYTSEFEKTFSDLKKMGSLIPSAKKTYEILQELNFETTSSQSSLLISQVHEIQYASNTNSYFYFYFPIVTHILHYKPEFENEILRYLIEPNFANGDTETENLIPLIQKAMNFKLSEDKYFLTEEGKDWIMNKLPTMKDEVEREVKKCWKELNR